ncbi:cytidine/deoxycytidylate deaminase family protein [Candidatus Uhrbacteria bacterium]|nr:cytidine/deoxycytidylate deaminase family protein [Candidatus Uhrbacteria bacterium]
MPDEQKCHRPDWDDYFMSIARIVAMRGTCDRLHAGAVLVKQKRIISSGYNGSPPGLKHCDDVGHLLEEGHCIRTIHGEHNAILQAATIPGASTEGATMYTKYNPCMHCSKYVVAAGIKRVVVGKLYRGEKAVEYLKEAGVQVDMYKENWQWNEALKTMFNEAIETTVAKEGDVKVQTSKP